MAQPTRRRGWISSLKNVPDSNWGNVEGFYEDISSIKAQPDGRIIVNSPVWGRIGGTEFPVAGDGFAFYHSSRAKFPSRDQYRRSPRISLVGELLDVGFSGQTLDKISVAVEPRVVAALEARPIVRDDKTKALFERSVPSGIPYSLYPVEPGDWLHILKLTQLALEDATDDESSDGTSEPLAFDHRVPERVQTTIERIIRDTALSKQIKQLHDWTCQLCSAVIELPDGTRYAEAHHLRPLGSPHDGPDSSQNLVCVCPTCHAKLDLGAISLRRSDLQIVTDHSLSQEFIDYHNHAICKLCRL